MSLTHNLWIYKEENSIKLLLITIFILIFFFVISIQEVLAQNQFQQSSVISGIQWDFSSHREEAPGSDNWPITWSDDDHQYTSWGDGNGFGSSRESLGVARIEGDSDNYTGTNVWSSLGKSYGLLSVDGILYMWVMVEGSYFSKSELYYSNNHGASWTSVGWRFENLGGAFSVPTFLNFGKDYEGARDNYVYIYAPGSKSGSFSSADGVVLARVPKDQIKNRGSYEFFAGLDINDNPIWDSEITNRKYVFDYPSKVHWTMSVAYVPGINRYLLFNNSRENSSQSSSSPGDLEIFDAPEPWGPWTSVASYSNWGDFGYTFSYYLAPKWISADGENFTFVFSGTGINDSWNTVNGSFILAVTDTTPPTIPQGVSALDQSENQINLTWQASNDPESGVSKYYIYRDTAKVGESTTTSYSDNGLNENTTYIYEVLAVNGVGLESDKSNPASVTTMADTAPPTVISAGTPGDPDKITIVFSEPVQQSSATNPTNYQISNGITVSGASLGTDLKTVALTTSTHSEGITYMLTINNVEDRAIPPNVITANTQLSYIFTNQLTVNNLNVSSSSDYEVLPDGLQEGALVYTDRGYTFTTVPFSLQEATYIKTANDDKASNNSLFLTFDVNQDVTVYVAYDDRTIPTPMWMSSFADTGDNIVTTDSTMSVYAKDFLSDTIVLGGNEGGDGSMYTVVIKPKFEIIDTISPSPPTGLRKK